MSDIYQVLQPPWHVHDYGWIMDRNNTIILFVPQECTRSKESHGVLLDVVLRTPEMLVLLQDLTRDCVRAMGYENASVIAANRLLSELRAKSQAREDSTGTDRDKPAA